MTAAGTEKVVRELYEAVGRRAFETATERVSELALVLNVATGDVYRGQAGFLEFFRGWLVAFPDLSLETLKVRGTEDGAVAEYELHGTHTGPLLSRRGHVPATAMDVQLRCCDVLDLRDGQVAHLRSYFDSASLLRQLGLLNDTPLHAPERRAPLELYAQPTESQAPQRHKSIIHRFLQEVFNRQNPGAAVDTCSSDYAWHGGSLGEARGLPGYQHVLATFFLAFPDLQIDVLDMLAEGDRVAVRFAMTGTHRGDFQGIPATFKRVAGSGTNTYRLEEGRIVEEWWQGDMLRLLQQMDAAPSTVRIGT